ncbi:MAG: PDZ domain-containing protein [Gammaproteobacteria bacterium]|nr:PDZ domain-containing protein [Gammaproteobacteria bacterium]NND58940.1 PDZ domain-containing protein [Gammaproteobacteria bacterium]
MKRLLIILLLAPLAVLAEGGDEQLAEQLRDAEARMRDAAREMAEIQMELHGDKLDHVFKFVHKTGPKRAMIGINVGADTDDPATREGVRVLGVTPGGPADKAGIRSGDLIIALDDVRLAGHDEDPDRKLMSLLDDIEPGTRVRVSYLRDGDEDTVEVETGEFSGLKVIGSGFDDFDSFDAEVFVRDTLEPVLERLPLEPLMHRRQWGGLELVPLTPQLGRYFGTDEGLLVVRSSEDNKLGLQDGDVIRTIGGATPKSPPDAMRMLRFYQPGDKLVIEILRDKRGRTLELVVPQRQS